MFEMRYPGGAGIHNGTSSAFTRAKIKATVFLPDGPVVQLPFVAPNEFIKIAMWKAQCGNRGAVIQVQSDDPDKARDLIIKAAA
jgi:hypothetical protein